MAKLRLTVGRGHVEELARLRHPVGAVEELIWNSLDADAENVTVELVKAGDHRLSTERDLARITAAIQRVVATSAAA